MEQKEGRALEINMHETIKVRDTFFLESWAKDAKRALSEVMSGWFPSKRTDLSPDGVQKERIINRRDNRYKEKVVDERMGRVIHDVEGKLTDHR